MTLTGKGETRHQSGATVDVATARRRSPSTGSTKTDRIGGRCTWPSSARTGSSKLLGRTGEPRPDRGVDFALKHREFREPVRLGLKSDGRGRIVLGPLADITSVTATGPGGPAHLWPLPADQTTHRPVIHAVAGQVVAVPYPDLDRPFREYLALFEVLGDDIRADRFDALAVGGGQLLLRGLAPGDYDLDLKRTGERIRVRVVAGPVVAGFVLGRARDLELPKLPPVAVAGVAADGDALVVRLTGASKYTRVHLFATRYRPAFPAFADLAKVRDAALTGVYPGYAPSVYLTGRNIGDEYRYVLDRRGSNTTPGTC